MSGPSVAAIEAALLSKAHVYPSFYACYLLRSLKKKYTSRTYVGSTPNPAKRLRQHNGEITAGARKTARYRPWEMLAIVYGFPSQIAALQFEWAWQNPHVSRQMPSSTKQVLHRTRNDRDTSPGQRRRGAKTKNRRLRPSLTMAGKLSNMHSMLTLEAWRRWPLKVKIFDEEVWNTWQSHIKRKGVPPLPAWITAELDLSIPVEDSIISEDKLLPTPPEAIQAESTSKKVKKNEKLSEPKKVKVPATSGGITGLDLADNAMRLREHQLLSELESAPPGQCSICMLNLTLPIQHDQIVICSNRDCHATIHIACMGKHLLAVENEILPTLGNCPSCDSLISWSDLIKGSKYRHLLSRKDTSAMDAEDEFAELEHDGSCTGSTSSSRDSDTDQSESAEKLMPIISKTKRSRTKAKAKTTKDEPATVFGADILSATMPAVKNSLDLTTKRTSKSSMNHDAIEIL